MNATIAILKWMDEDERERNKSRSNGGVDARREKALRHLCPGGHQVRHIFWLGTD